jgi:hypothetical protein
MHKKQDRSSLTPDVLNKLFKDATSLKHKKYDYVPMILNDEDGLDDTYNLDVLINKTYREHCAFDLHDVFTVIIPLHPDNEDNDEVACTMDLYTEYADISIEDVARSNAYYREWLVDPWFEENLRLTYTFFQNNVTDDLFLKVSETYDKYPRSERGGPLFFILMLNQLLADTEEAAASLQKRVKDFKISNIEGENIRKVVSLLRGAVTRLTYIKKVPEDFPKILLQVMQTSSVDSFNETFHLIEKQRKHRTVLRRTGRHDPDVTVDDIFLLAEAEYRDLFSEGLWTGASNSGAESVFNAQGNTPWTPTCFNCGGPHTNKECPKPKDQARIMANLKKFREAQTARDAARGGTGTRPKPRSESGQSRKPNTGIYRPPTAAENNLRTINGKPMHWGTKQLKWFPARRLNATPATTPAANAAIVPSPAPASAPAPLAVPAGTGKNQMVTLAIANSARAVNAAFENLALQFMDE